MRFFVSVLFLFLAVLNTANASHGKSNSTTTSKSKNESPSCARARLLAQGIEMNIKDQRQEQASLEKIVSILAQTPVDQNAFAEAKANLINFVQLGIAMRKMNQMIATADNPANPGLNIVSFVATIRVDEANKSPYRSQPPNSQSLACLPTLPAIQTQTGKSLTL
jgi:hypothetical protein